jgi:hypothetical protein
MSDTRQACAAITDGDLLAMIRRGDVSPITDTHGTLSYWERDTLMRAEAKRRGIL